MISISASGSGFLCILSLGGLGGRARAGLTGGFNSSFDDAFLLLPLAPFRWDFSAGCGRL